mmetsp:Transcript_8573/g.14526  ORF Transcript_8573/g.14526 Transcript_8573/m.14526 type:complete len:104 (+) Transcript_8573:65-376(+)
MRTEYLTADHSAEERVDLLGKLSISTQGAPSLRTPKPQSSDVVTGRPDSPTDQSLADEQQLIREPSLLLPTSPAYELIAPTSDFKNKTMLWSMEGMSSKSSME